MSDNMQPLLDSIKQLALTKKLPENEQGIGFCHKRWQACAGIGLTGLNIDGSYQGQGLNSSQTAQCMETFGRYCDDMGLVYSIATHLFAGVSAITKFASPELKNDLLPALAAGKLIAANCMTEPMAGSDAFAMQTTATKEQEYYILNGNKGFVSNGPIADTFVVYASTNLKYGYMGVSAFLVQRGTPGFVIEQQAYQLTGLQSSAVSSVSFNHCKIPAANRLGKEGAGASIFNHTMLWERSCLFAGFLGQLQRQLQQCIEHANQRQQFGKPIAKNQAISHRIVDMSMRLEAARCLVYKACADIDNGEEATKSVAFAKIATSEAAVQSGLDAIQIFGAKGYKISEGIDTYLKDALGSRIYSGSNEIQKNLIAIKLGLNI
jgi:alkylation response protein AidB-like acyl-CoA dehydrogenase